DIFGGPPGSHASSGPVIPEDIDLFGDAKPQEFQGASQSDHAPSDQAFFAPPKVKAETIPDDWDLSDLGVALGPAGPHAAGPAPRPGPPAPAQRAPAASSAGDDSAIAGFLAAVGLPGMALTPADKAKLLREAGAALAETVKGLTEILAARAN